jgi:multimeric flavodoxin WrbA
MASASSEGNTKLICDYISQEFDFPLLDFNDFHIDYYSYTKDVNRDDFIGLVQQILEYDTIVFVTPVYWYSMSAQLKTFFDRITDLLKHRKDLGRQLRTKNMKVICCSSDQTEYPEFWRPFQRSADYLGMQYQGEAHTWTIDNASIPEIVKTRLNHLFEQG